MAELEPVEFKNLSSGLMTEGAVAESRIPTDAVTESINLNFDKIGAATLRKGTTALGTGGVLSGALCGLYEFRDSGSGVNNQIIAVNGTVAYYLSGTTWTSKRTSLTSGAKARFTTFLDYVWMANGYEATAIWTGAAADSFVTTGNASGAPTGKFIDNFRSRVWIAGNSTYPDRLYYSSIPSSETTPVVSWNTSVTTGDWIDISPSDGENITGIKRHKLALLVFKNNHIYRVYSVSATDPDPTINVGTYSQESIVETKDGVYFHHPSGFYRYSDGAVQEISKPIIDIVNNITRGNYSDICGWLETDGDHITWALGPVTVNGVAHDFLEVRYTLSTQTWTHYSKPTQAKVSSSYDDQFNLFRLVGDSAGNVLKVNTGNDDNGTPISYSLVHRWNNLDGLLHTEKHVEKMLFHNKGGINTKVQYQRDGDLAGDWSKSVGPGFFSGDLSYFNNANVVGRKVRFRISGSSQGEPFTYNGFEVIKGVTNLINK